MALPSPGASTLTIAEPRPTRAPAVGDPSWKDNLEDGGGRGAAHAAGGVERVDAEELVQQAAGDAKHCRAAVLALGVELEGLGLGVVVAHPRDAGDVTGLAVNGLRLGEREEGRLRAGAGLLHTREEHDLQPARGGHGLERREEAGGGGEALLGGDLGASLDRDDVEEAKHGRAAVLDLHDLVAGHVAGLDEAERVIDAEGREDANVTLREHLDLAGTDDRRLEGV